MKTVFVRWIIVSSVLCLVLWMVGCKNTASDAPGAEKSGDTLTGRLTSGGCNHAYFPASPTLKKTYRLTYSNNSMPSSEYTESYGGFKPDGFTQKMEFTTQTDKKSTKDLTNQTVVVETGVKCGPDGLAILDYGKLSAGQNLQYKYKTLRAEGVTFAPESEWKVGKKWQMIYDIEGEMTMAPTPALNIAPKGTVTLSFEIIGEEKVTVPAGSFDTFKVAMNFNNKLTMKMMGREMPMDNTFKSTVWFAREVGMVKTVADVANATTELITLTK